MPCLATQPHPTQISCGLPPSPGTLQRWFPTARASMCAHNLSIAAWAHRLVDRISRRGPSCVTARSSLCCATAYESTDTAVSLQRCRRPNRKRSHRRRANGSHTCRHKKPTTRQWPLPQEECGRAGGGGDAGATSHKWHELLHFLAVLGTLHCPFVSFFWHLLFLKRSWHFESKPVCVLGGYGGNAGPIGSGGGAGSSRARFKQGLWSELQVPVHDRGWQLLPASSSR